LGANANLLSNDDRLKGYKQAFSELKVKFDPHLMVSADLNRRGGFDGVQELLKTEDPPTAVLCFNDVVALGAMEGIQRLGLKPGIDFGVVGFNNIPGFGIIGFNDVSADTEPALTTIKNLLPKGEIDLLM
jgi:LacI family transcriptional regulator